MLFLMIRRSPVTICLWYLSKKGELLHLHVDYLRLLKINPNLDC